MTTILPRCPHRYSRTVNNVSMSKRERHTRDQDTDSHHACLLGVECVRSLPFGFGRQPANVRIMPSQSP